MRLKWDAGAAAPVADGNPAHRVMREIACRRCRMSSMPSVTEDDAVRRTIQATRGRRRREWDERLNIFRRGA
jgi:hypothetical protein